MKKQRKKFFAGPFVGVLKDTMQSPAWRAMSYGARLLYIHARGELRNDAKDNGHRWLSCRDAAKGIGTRSMDSIHRWFTENEHYGFMRKTGEGFLGSDGRGIAAKHRLTDYAYGTQPPTRDFMKWDGTPFVYTPRRPRRKQNPVPKIGTPRSDNRNIRKGSGNGSACSENRNISKTPKCSDNRYTSRLARGNADPNPNQGSSSRAPAQAGDVGSNPAPEAMATSRGR